MRVEKFTKCCYNINIRNVRLTIRMKSIIIRRRYIYLNSDEKLPIENGRVWYEADINYTKSYRNGERVLYSSDGLIFVTYDHYKTFYEITK